MLASRVASTSHVNRRVGLRALAVVDPVQGVGIPAWLLHPAATDPAAAEERTERFGPYELSVARDAPLAGPVPRLVVVSHGNGGSPWTHRTTAAHLAQAGFAVALLEHPGNSRSDNTLAGTPANLVNRPRHVRAVIDAVLADPGIAPHIPATGIAVLGHSIGAYTALAVAGGQPHSLPTEEPDRVPRALAVERDPRVTAVILLAPAAVWFAIDGSLAGVDADVLMRTGALDALAPALHGEIITRGIRAPRRLDHVVVPGAGHFSFQSPFPPAMVSPAFPPSQDPPGFDRAAYLPQLDAEIVAFLRGM